jgi:aspartyl-tRNA(Asn)/glutamyl-tRNA(Gln) amidotransferase subunit B
VDYNRSGIPLIEVVTDPDLRSPKEARRFINTLRTTLEYLGVFDGEREGGLRVDANISMEGGNRVEVKNISSYKGVEKALTFEITRQRNVLRRGLAVGRETRHFLEARGVTTSARSKEEEHDYRYFPEPDLRPLRVQGWFREIALPELPAARRARFGQAYGVSPGHARTLCGDLKIADFYEDVACCGDSVLAATWVADILLGELNYRDMLVARVPAGHFTELLQLLGKKEITDRGGVDVLRVMLDQVAKGEAPETPSAIVARLNLGKAGGDEFGPVIREVVEANPAAVNDFRGGKGEALNYLVGQAMKRTRGRADPKELARMIRDAIGEAGVAP